MTDDVTCETCGSVVDSFQQPGCFCCGGFFCDEHLKVGVVDDEFDFACRECAATAGNLSFKSWKASVTWKASVKR